MAISRSSSAVAEPEPSVRSTTTQLPASVAASSMAAKTALSFMKIRLLMEPADSWRRGREGTMRRKSPVLVCKCDHVWVLMCG